MKTPPGILGYASGPPILLHRPLKSAIVNCIESTVAEVFVIGATREVPAYSVSHHKGHEGHEE